ncbi:MAG: SRPBCC family protein [Phycisphaerales bacterium]|nr:SRPBCC family protein [Phycisphaerales bacterium]
MRSLLRKGHGMLWTLVGLVLVFLGLIGIVILLGVVIPRSHTATSRIVVPAAQQDVWNTLIDFEHHPEWRKMLEKIEQAQPIDGKPVWIEYSKFGRMPMQVDEMTEPSLLRMRIADDKLPFGGTWTFELSTAPDDAQRSTLQITEDGVISNPIYRVMSRFAMGYHAVMDQYLKDMATKYGATTPKPEHVSK